MDGKRSGPDAFTRHKEPLRWLIAGLVLTPFAGFLGAVIVVVLDVLGTPRIGPAHWENVFVVAVIGLPMGSMFAAPVTLVVLPAVRWLCWRRAGCSTGAFLAAGFVGGLVCPLLTIKILTWGAPFTNSQHVAEFLVAGAAVGTCVAWPFSLFTKP